ncbi:hypothetical protein OEA41_010227 [Lepraria neglecta]|uniref:Uncharacterized protein n=1 Tax=Lepraria neglecta TaxID=209136 RepID=A0AAD9YYN4_9LECA|nr:hypothetical protein OEA41_010227 [Lepraria neglecta]
MATIIIKLVRSGIGLAAEARAAKKASKNSAKTTITRVTTSDALANAPTNGDLVQLPENQANELIAKGQAVPIDQNEYAQDTKKPPPRYTSEEENDEADWALDDAAEEQVGGSTPSADDERTLGKVPTGEKERQHYVDKISPFRPAPKAGQLPCPVILPQRRPKDKTRGFVRAYAPVLAECGIDQATFLQFIKTIDKASEETVDMSQTITKSLTSSEFAMKRQFNSMKSSSGKTHGELEMLEAAPLIFPNLDALAAAEGSDSKKKSGLKKTGVFLGDYFDRRAQASYIGENPDTKLAAANPVQPKFASAYGDPTSSTYSGSIVSFLTGGKIDAANREGRIKGGFGKGPLGLIGEGLAVVDHIRGKKAGDSNRTQGEEMGRGMGGLGGGLGRGRGGGLEWDGEGQV